jgi:signal transduction histidine kinase
MRKHLFILLVVIVIAIGMAHFFTPADLFFYHDTYRRLSYFPIVLGAIWFGFRGGVILAVLSSIFFIPHILLFIGKGPETYINELLEIFLYLAAGSVTGLIVSRQNKLREQYKALSEKLEKSYSRLHQETKLLIEVEEQLSASQKFSALGQLSASLAHEIKNPLSSIKGTAEILLDEFPEGHPKREFAQILLKETTRLNTTVEEVLQYSRGQQSEKGPSEAASRVIHQVARLLKSQLQKKAIDLTINLSPESDAFNVDRSKMSQVFLNIILNSIDAVPNGGRIRIETERNETGLIIHIADNGPGVPAEDRERVFTPFVTGKEDGTGLGLPISRKIVERYGGSLTVTDSDMGGACFTILLPTAPNLHRTPLPEDNHEENKSGKREQHHQPTPHL